MKSYEGWTGTVKENKEVIQDIANNIRNEHFSALSKKQFNQLFIEAFTRNLVQNELIDMMEFIYTEE